MRELSGNRPSAFIFSKDTESFLDQVKGIGVYFRGSPGSGKENCSERLLVRKKVPVKWMSEQSVALVDTIAGGNQHLPGAGNRDSEFF